MHPVLFEIGDFPVGSYALMALLALAAGVAVFSWLGARAGHERLAFVEMGLWSFIVAILASKLFGALLDFDVTSPADSLRKVLRFSGHYYVGVLAGVAYLVWAFRRNGVSLGRGLDYLAPGLAVSHAIGRIGCFLAGCCWGKECARAWAVTFTSEKAHEITGVPLGVPLHPTQLYEAVTEAILFGGLLLWHLVRPGFAGSTFLRYIVLYGIARFFLETLRADERGQFLGSELSTSQGLALVSVIAAAAIHAWLWKRDRGPGEGPGRGGKRRAARAARQETGARA